MRRAVARYLVAVMLVVGLVAVAPIAGAQDGEQPTATEIGVTDDEIRIAVIADVETPAAPGLFQGSVDGVRGFAKYVNANGGLAGRKVVVDFIDSKLNADEARNAVIKACSEDFALVGTSAIFMNNVDDMVNCVDQAGNAIGIPDIPFVTTEVVHQCSPVSYPVAPPQILCETKDQSPQTYQANIGRGHYYKKKYGDDLHGVYLFPGDIRASRNSTFASLGQLRQVCCKSDQDFDMSSRAQQAEYGPAVQAMKDNGSNYAQAAGPFNQTVALRKEAKLQGVTDVDVWDCGTQCYSRQFLEQGGSDVEGQYVDTLYLPFFDPAERKANKTTAAFVKNTGEEEAGGLGAVYAFAAGMAFKEAVDRVVEQHGVNGLTRANLFAALDTINEFDAGGLLAPIDLAGRRITDCHVLLQVRDGDFVRVQPKKPGKFHCGPENVIETKLDLIDS